ncbi:thioesterase family protein, partial [Acinetobacter variabilis]|uniref:thioesterase family protein n=1 Tax=Acinetobacter variabilis TaxID=70346 RepID=UPI0030F6704C
VLFNQLCDAFNAAPFYQYCGMQMRVVDGQIEAYVAMQKDLIGNVAFQILHGGVAATILDSIGGITAMGELYKKASPEDMQEASKKVSRLATVDMRVDYLAPGRGKYFTARAETLR